MNIEIRDAALQARLQKQLEATGSGSAEELLSRLLQTQEEQDRWLFENREVRSLDCNDRPRPAGTIVFARDDRVC